MDTGIYNLPLAYSSSVPKTISSLRRESSIVSKLQAKFPKKNRLVCNRATISSGYVLEVWATSLLIILPQYFNRMYLLQFVKKSTR